MMIEITPVLDHESKSPLYIQLADYIKYEIITGKIKPKEKLPSKRNLSQYLHLSLNTIQSAYEQLVAEGYVESMPRKGLFVTHLDDNFMNTIKPAPKPILKNEKVQEKGVIDFHSGKVDLVNFPYAIWRKLSLQSLYEDQGDIFYNGHPQGEHFLREKIAEYLFASRGVKCSTEQIIIGAGTQVLIGLLCLIIGKEYTYALENPGFHRTRSILQDLSIPTIPIPLDENGIQLKQLNESHANIAYVTPSHQFPYGMVMPITRRLELLKWAQEKGGYVIEDDYDSEYRYKGKPIPSLQGMDTNGRVIYLGTFSKSLIPSIRISYMVLPFSLLKRYHEHFTIYKQTASRLHQITLSHFMNDGHWQRHLNKMRTLYRKKQGIFIQAIRKYLGDKVKIIGDHSGLHIVLEVNNGMQEEILIQSAKHAGVKIYPISIYYFHSKDIQVPRVLLGFGGLSESEIDRGIRLLRDAWG